MKLEYKRKIVSFNNFLIVVCLLHSSILLYYNGCFCLCSSADPAIICRSRHWHKVGTMRLRVELSEQIIFRLSGDYVLFI
ncbi:hypothetical protein RJT34_02450 [Clitoria ternatea]|uniref:Uncharacterized protein n=1 Tax=Clitoria ternatea TaxID=43366 RepID=A0AAN9Q0Y6_CLITE